MTAYPTPEPMPEGMTLEEYYEWENEQEAKHEFDGGEILAMAGTSENHVDVCVNITAALHDRLKGKPCKPKGSDFRIGFPSKTYSHYADISVVCGPSERDPRDKSGQTFFNPTVVFEVASPSTQSRDRTLKFDRYRELASFREFVIVYQDRAEVQTFFKQPDSTWLFSTFTGPEAVVPLKSIDVVLPLAEIYDRVTFDAPPAG